VEATSRDHALSTKEPLVRSLPDQIADRLRNDLMCGRMAPGERLVENELVERFGVSRTPIRTALVQLAQEGLFELHRNAGVRVTSQPPNGVRDLLIPIRCTTEVFALRSFFDEINQEDLKRWKDILGNLKKACAEKDYPAIAENDLAFHRSIIQRSGYPDLEAIWSAIFVRVRHHFLEAQKEYKDPMKIYEDHAAIVRVFGTGDVDASVKALANNIE